MARHCCAQRKTHWCMRLPQRAQPRRWSFWSLFSPHGDRSQASSAPGTKCNDPPGIFHHGASTDRERYRRVKTPSFCSDPLGDGVRLRVRSDRMVEEFSLFGVREISGPQRKSGCQKRSCATATPVPHPRIPAMKISCFLAALLLASLATSATARPRIDHVAARAHPNVIEGRQIAAPPWSAACATDQGPRECGEPMWIYGTHSEIARYRNAF